MKKLIIQICLLLFVCNLISIYSVFMMFQNQASMLSMKLATAEFSADYYEAQLAFVSTRHAGLWGFPDIHLTETPVLNFLATATQISRLNNQNFIIEELDFKGVQYEMAFVARGCFYMGSFQIDLELEPVHQICIEEDFWIDRTEVSQAQYHEFMPQSELNAGDNPLLPQAQITWLEAYQFCAARGARLPSEAEWEYAARGLDSLKFPWGNDFDSTRLAWAANSREVMPSASYENGLSWVGAYDMAGNLWEWVNSTYSNYPYSPTDGRENSPEEMWGMARGGSFTNFSQYFFLTSQRYVLSRNTRRSDLGFRCVDYDIQQADGN
jgi:hypothetical protein